MSDPENNEEFTRKALHDAVSDVHPEHRFAEVGEPGGRSRWPLVVLASAAAVAVIIGGVVFAQRGGDPTTSSGPAASPTAVQQRLEVTAYFLHDTAYGPRIYPETRVVQGDPKKKAEAAVNAALSAKPAVAGDAGSPFPDSARATVTGSGGNLTVNLEGPSLTKHLAGYDADKGPMALQALIWSATGSAADKVTFTIDGKETGTVLGAPVSPGMTRGNPDDVLPRVIITTPTPDQIVGSSFTVTGQGSAFEANLVWALRAPDNKVVKKGFTTAKECCTLAPFSFTVSGVPAGSYELEVHTTDESDGEGLGVEKDTRQITVS